MLTALVSLVSSCSSSDDEKQGPFQQCFAPIDMVEVLDMLDSQNKPYVIVDFRKKDDYNKSHINGAVHLGEATYTNMNDGSFAKAIHDYTGTYAINVFLVGSGNNTLTTTLGGSVSKSGYGYGCTYTLVCSYDKFVAAYPERCTR